MKRKQFIQIAGMGLASLGLPFISNANISPKTKEGLFFKISLAEWSLHRLLFNGDINHLDFPVLAKNEFDISAVEYVSQFFQDKASDKSYLNEMNRRCEDHGVKQLLIMVDSEGELAVNDNSKRTQAVENHYQWVEAAAYLGCHSIRVNIYGNGSAKDQKLASIDSLGTLSEFAEDFGINILVENHGGYSSNGQWISDIMRQVNRDNCGTLPDFGNFCIAREEGGACAEEYDRYKGVKELMPFAKGVSAKSYAFDDAGKETTIDYSKMLAIVRNSGYNAHIGIEYEGSQLSEFDGIRATKKLLEIERGR